jgi:hypothetical protein
MKTNSTVRTDLYKNRIYLYLEGYHDIEEATRMKELYKKAIESCTSGFTVLADVSAYKPGSDDVQEVHAEAVKLARDAGVRKVARVVGEKPLGGMQIERIADDEGHYEAAHFETAEEAEQYLDEE